MNKIDIHIEENIKKITFFLKLKSLVNETDLSTENIETIINSYDTNITKLARLILRNNIFSVSTLENFINAGLDMNSEPLFGYLSRASPEVKFYILDNYNISNDVWKSIILYTLGKNFEQELKNLLSKYDIPQSVLDAVCLRYIVGDECEPDDDEYGNIDKAIILIENGANILLDKFKKFVEVKKNRNRRYFEGLKKLEDYGADIKCIMLIKKTIEISKITEYLDEFNMQSASQ